LVDQEAEAGFRSISVPLLRRDGKVVAALNVGVHSERGPLKTMHNVFLPRLRQLAETLRPQMF
jgi:IclR family pca regulon transcriptional regulator